ncbi:hypothetical protein HELRODRAFT_163421 [Helobdella robusta]|uniref:Uncharacterized protein n=1 Tax=Helobdella robusta TaxID=6412 RepID=T1EU10_HELRO|nr:hypothetical protein HELRODRAFT_163421 [Helobdella robusta]ESN96366.1 hypothetical protein HELRODRAFT_163421 [Helobdella robusta]
MGIVRLVKRDGKKLRDCLRRICKQKNVEYAINDNSENEEHINNINDNFNNDNNNNNNKNICNINNSKNHINNCGNINTDNISRVNNSNNNIIESTKSAINPATTSTTKAETTSHAITTRVTTPMKAVDENLYPTTTQRTDCCQLTAEKNFYEHDRKNDTIDICNGNDDDEREKDEDDVCDCAYVPILSSSHLTAILILKCLMMLFCLSNIPVGFAANPSLFIFSVFSHVSLYG